MSFLYPAFLAGALAIAIPIVLHFLRRDVAPEVPFSAVRLLKRSPIERSHRRRLRDLLLLAARVAALLLLAAAFARPYVAGAASPRATVRIVAIDRSFSMGAPGQFGRALDLARAAIGEASSGERVAAVAFDERVDVLSAPASPGAARAALAGLSAGFGATRYAPVVAKAVEIADGAPSRLVVITDLQRSGWEADDRPAVPTSMQVEVRDVGAPRANLAITAVRVERDRLVATVRNAGPAPASGAVHVARDGAEVATGQYTAAAGVSLDASIPYHAPGSGSLVVSLDDPSGYPADNSRYVLLDPAPRSTVLVITTTGTGGSGFYLTRALGAAAEDAGTTSPIDPRVVGGQAFSAMSRDDVSQYRAIVLLSTRGLDRRARDSMNGFVTRGGGLFIAASADVEPAVLSTIFDWQPALGAVAELQSVALSATDLRHPIFRPFGALAANLGQVRFARAWRVRADGWDVAARFTDGAPALLERREGQGRIVLFTSDVDRRWNEFPLNPSFVPFAVETVRYVSGAKTLAREFLVAHAPEGTGAKPGVYGAADRAIVVNVDPQESATARVTAAEFTDLVDRVETAVRDGAGLVAQVEARQSYWRYGLLLMIGVLVTESFVGRA
jgi:Aerotolerance regulator N-terminal/von Willebrand factor type A domain